MAVQRRTQQERRAATRAALLAAAGPVFAKDGFAAASLDAIAAEAGLTKGAIYSNFDGKTDLFLSLIEHLNAHWMGQVDEILAQADGATLETVLDNISDLLRTGLAPDDSTANAMIEARALALHDAAARQRLTEIQQELLSRVDRVVRAVTEQAGLTLTVDVEELAAMIVATAGGLNDMSIVDPSGGHRERIALLPMILTSFIADG